MKSSLAVVASFLLAGVAGAQSGSGVVKWDIQKRQQPQDFKRLGRRASTYEEVISNEDARGGYFATCSLGTPSQNLTLQLDTGSSDIWVPDTAAAVCRAARTRGCDLGAFNPDKSSTYVTVGAGLFDIQYVDGSSSKGDYFTDVFEIAGAKVKNMTMGLGVQTDIAYGLVGVGYALNEAIVGDTQQASSAYPNLPVTMMNEGLINTVAYSLWLNDLDANLGNILFGGIDTEKYRGELTRIDIYPVQKAFTSFLVALTSLEASSPSGSDTLTSSKFPIPVVLDSGTTLSYLPQDLAVQLWKEAGAVYSSQFNLAVLPCQMQNSKGSFSFGFAGPDGPRISVGMDELVLDLTAGQPPLFTNGPYKGMAACEFGIQNFTKGPYLLGDTFLRSAYVVYDLVNNQIGIAPTDFNSTKSNIVAFASQGAPIPSATVAPNQSQVTNQPSVTSPAYAASPGFTDSAGVKDGASAMAQAFGLTQICIVGLSLVLAVVV